MANTDESEFASNHPTDDQKFIDILGSIRPDWVFEAFNVTHNVFPQSLNIFDGIIITGSPASANDKDLWVSSLINIVKKTAQLNIPLFGSCFGHQVIAKAFGSEIVKNPDGWSLGLVETNVVRRETWMNGLETNTLLYSAHTEQVAEVPNEAELLFKSEGCDVAGFTLGNNIFTTQYHPEMRELQSRLHLEWRENQVCCSLYPQIPGLSQHVQFPEGNQPSHSSLLRVTLPQATKW